MVLHYFRCLTLGAVSDHVYEKKINKDIYSRTQSNDHLGWFFGYLGFKLSLVGKFSPVIFLNTKGQNK